jgi:hypothetical protein
MKNQTVNSQNAKSQLSLPPRLWAIVMFALSPLILTGCLQAASNSDAASSVNSTNATGGTIAIIPATITVAPSAVIDFSATGGSGKYSYTTFSSSGNLNATTGVYTAPSTVGQYTVVAVDSNNNYATATITVSNWASATTGTLSLSPTSSTVTPGQVINISVSGGSGNYVFALSSGGGTLSQGATYAVFTAPTAEGTSIITVTDSTTNQTASSTLTISNSAPVTTPPVTTVPQNVPIYRLYHPDLHDFMFSTQAYGGNGYRYQEEAFLLLSQPVNGSLALYQCLTPNGHHLLTTQPNCEGNTMQSTLGYVMKAGSAAFPMPIYRFNFQNRAQATWATVDYNEAQGNNDSFQLVIGYVSAQ